MDRITVLRRWAGARFDASLWLLYRAILRARDDATHPLPLRLNARRRFDMPWARVQLFPAEDRRRSFS